MINIIQLIVALIISCVFMPFLTFLAIIIWKDLHGDKNWGLKMWVRYMMNGVPRESEEDIVSLLKRNTLDER